MSRSPTLTRTKALVQHMMQSTSTSARPATDPEPPVLFEENGSIRRYILNRPKKLNALDEPMINLLRPKLEQWENSELCRIVIGTGAGRGFCAGGDVERVVKDGADERTRPSAINYFKLEFELDYQLATLQKPYVAICDGFTMGGGVGLLAHAQFRIATEKTKFAMPETKIGYCPDVGANYFLPKLDGAIGTYLALTGASLDGRAVFEHGLATHFVPSSRVPQLLGELASFDEPTPERINSTIEEFYGERSADEQGNAIVGDIRVAVDTAFGRSSVEKILESLTELSGSSSEAVATWAKATLAELNLRSPTSLVVALEAVRRGKQMSLGEVLQMEMGIATAFLSGGSPDFKTGVTAVLIDKIRDARPAWSPNTLEEINQTELIKSFFDSDSQFLNNSPSLELPQERWIGAQEHGGSMKFALPSEEEIERIVRGTHAQSSSMAYSLDDLINKFSRMMSQKHGVEDKIREVAARRCVVTEDRWLSWKS
ncbi:3-hydroxyisobutyryl-coenzyme A hydrolase [Schizopora paradoxa]|uniref:3-hydroxyisobutyryl-CoA hydrolase n=1 Tax=Schizopora paradoxa TaxID=27342 RepID=A0A0H2SBQ4_9AGAM|nr:3-hydroxyisobutyryl-coenzyme A hydrolase [Schizopora paradoxa]